MCFAIVPKVVTRIYSTSSVCRFVFVRAIFNRYQANTRRVDTRVLTPLSCITHIQTYIDRGTDEVAANVYFVVIFVVLC